MELKYEFQTSSSVYNDEFDEEYSDYDTYYYEPSRNEIETAIEDIIYKNYLNDAIIDTQTFKKKLKELLSNLDIEAEDYFEEELKEYFKDDAYESYMSY